MSKKIRSNSKLRPEIFKNAIEIKEGSKGLTKDDLKIYDRFDYVLWYEGNGNYNIMGFRTDIKFKSIVL